MSASRQTYVGKGALHLEMWKMPTFLFKQISKSEPRVHSQKVVYEGHSSS